MQVVHGLWTTMKKEGPGLFIWLEDARLRTKNQLFEPISDFQPGGRGKLRGKPSNTPDPHPFALDAENLNGKINDLLSQSLNPTDLNGIVTNIDLALPTADDAPLPSPWLNGRKKESIQGREIVLQPWRVFGVHLPPPVALKWMNRLNPARRQPSLIYGESIKFWKDAANLVFYSLIHGTYEPALVKVDHQIRCKWMLNTKILANQLENLQKRLPVSCEHEWSQDGTRRTRESIVREFFDTSIDFLIRNVVGPRVIETFVQRKSSRKRKKQNPLDSLTSPLLKGLYGKQNSFSAARDVQAAFVALVTNWLQQSHTGQTRQWTTCFTVLPPEIGKAKIEDIDPKARVWRIAFSLQNVKDPSQHIYAQEIWENLVPLETSGGRTLAEQFLRELGRALQYFPQLDAALQHPWPTYVDLTTEEAYNFLSEQSLHLQSADFGVVAPPWWKKRTQRLTTKIEIDSSVFEGQHLMGFDSVVDFSWKASVGNRTLTEQAFRKLVKDKIALLPIDGHWVEVKPEDLWETVHFFEDRDTSGKMTLGEAMHLGMKNKELKSVLDDVAFDYEGSLSQLFASQEDSLPEVTQPLTLNGQLRPYQLRGMSWLIFNDRLGFGACLADDMGLGKTVQLLSLILHERETSKIPMHSKPTLLVCPMSVVGNWFREAARFTPNLRVMIHHGASRHGKHIFSQLFNSYDLIITTYHLVNRDQHIFGEINWHRVALDEAQNIKNPSAQQTQAIQKIKTTRRIALTGTPVENKLSELWSIMEFLNPGYLGSLKNFQAKFAVPIERQNDQQKAKLLRQLTRPFILRRLKTDKRIIQDLPEKIEMKVYCDLTEEQAAIYEAYSRKQLEEIEKADGIKRNQLVLTTLMKLKQICNHPIHFLADETPVEERSGKLMRLEEMLEEALEEGDSSLIFTQFTQMGMILQTYLQKKFNQEVLFMHGGVTQEKRQDMVDRFQSGKGPKLFILTVKTGGTGLNLTVATHVFHFDRWWNPAVENQATDRAFRIGQHSNVQVHKMISIGTLEDRIDQMIEHKKQLAENVIGGTDESWLTQLSTDALREVLTLSANEV